MTGYALGLAEAGAADPTTVGGKGASLGELTRAGVRVPAGFAVTAAAFEEAMAALDPGGAQRNRITGLDPADLVALSRVGADLRRAVVRAPLPEPVRRAVLARYRELDPGGAAPVAVRSSATSEDGVEASFAGLQDSYLWVRGEPELLGHLRRCWASLYNAESIAYRLRRGLPEEGLAMAVVIQRMVDPRCAGVMFTRSPTTGDRSVVVVEAAWGLGSALVSGAVTPDHFVVNRVTGEIVKRVVASKARRHRRRPDGTGVLAEENPAELRDACCLSDPEIGALVAVATRIERHYGGAQDIEWALAPDPAAGSHAAVPGEAVPGEAVFVLQSRPETVWSRRPAAPVVPPRPRALDHVLDLLGGRVAKAPG
jgi:phosphoenolpyruvate synthase/pyruvate phosphate dikinase